MGQVQLVQQHIIFHQLFLLKNKWVIMVANKKYVLKVLPRVILNIHAAKWHKGMQLNQFNQFELTTRHQA